MAVYTELRRTGPEASRGNLASQWRCLGRSRIELFLSCEALFPAEQARIVQLHVQRIELKPDGLELRLRTQGLGHVMQRLSTIAGRLREYA